MRPVENETYLCQFGNLPVSQITGAMLTSKARTMWQEGDFRGAISLLSDTLPELDTPAIGKIIDGTLRLTGIRSIKLGPDNWIRPTGYRDFSLWFKAVTQALQRRV